MKCCQLATPKSPIGNFLSDFNFGKIKVKKCYLKVFNTLLYIKNISQSYQKEINFAFCVEKKSAKYNRLCCFPTDNALNAENVLTLVEANKLAEKSPRKLISVIKDATGSGNLIQ